MSEYNPFSKPLDLLSGEDLAVLSSVSEGWYVEYKSELPKAASISKSISAFANTYGGWLFIGIGEKSKDDPVAGDFIGIARADVDAAIQTIRHAAAQSINPTPHFDVRAVWGPAPGIGLAKDKAIICVSVPWGFSSPYIHKSGMIYRRVGDCSDPRPENDRFILDNLWKRGDEVRKDYRDWVGREVEFSKGEADQPFFRLLITPDLWREQNVWADLNTEKVREVMSETGNPETFISTPFDCVYRSSKGYVGRQIKGNNPHNLSTTWFLKPNLSSEILMPFPVIKDVTPYNAETELDGYVNAGEFSAAMREQGHELADILDMNFLFAALIGVLHIQCQLDKLANRSGTLFVKAQLLNVWRHRPFLDVAQVVSYQRQHGIPICMNGNILAPPGDEPDDFKEVPPLEDVEGANLRKFFQAMYVFEPIAAAVGIETGLSRMSEANSEENPSYIYPELINACTRANEAQRLRNERRPH